MPLSIPGGVAVPVPVAQIVKTVSESKVTDTTLADDAELLLPVEANKLYQFELTLFYKSSSSGDFKCRMIAPSGATGKFSTSLLNSGSTTTDIGSTNTFGVSGTSVVMMLRTGTLLVDATAGNLSFQWAQNVSDAINTEVFLGSSLRLWGNV